MVECARVESIIYARGCCVTAEQLPSAACVLAFERDCNERICKQCDGSASLRRVEFICIDSVFILYKTFVY